MTQADLMPEAVPALATNAPLCGDKAIRCRDELVCCFFRFYRSNESHPNACTDGVDYIYCHRDDGVAVLAHEAGEGAHAEGTEVIGAFQVVISK